MRQGMERRWQCVSPRDRRSVAPLLVVFVAGVFGCTPKPIESHYPVAAVRQADHVILETKDVDLIDGYHNLGIVAGNSCDSRDDAEKMIRLEAAKVGANKVVKLQCWVAGPLSGCFAQTYYCKGKAISLDDANTRDAPPPPTGS